MPTHINLSNNGTLDIWNKKVTAQATNISTDNCSMCSSMSVKCVHQPHSSSFFVPLSRVVTQFFLFLYCKLLWRGLKFVTRKFTGRCELQRICYNNKHGARRTLKIGRSASTFCHQSSLSSSFTFLWQYGHILTNELRLLILFYFPLKTKKQQNHHWGTPGMR